MTDTLTVLCPGDAASERYALTLKAALKGTSARVRTCMDVPLKNQRILFAVPLDESGVNHGYNDLLAYLRTHPGCLDGSVSGVLVDGPGDLYTKAVGRELVLAASQAGCTVVGRPLVEGTGDLRNFTVQAKNAGCDLPEAYRLAASDLVRRVLDFTPSWHQRPMLLVLHASNHKTSNTLALWSRCRKRLERDCDITEIGLRNGTLEDCAGCPYTMCLHFGEKDSCFYGGVVV